MRPKNYFLPSVIWMNETFYVPTRFMACIKGHVYGGIIKYEKGSGNAKVVLYDNDGESSFLSIPINYLTSTLNIVCNSDKAFGYDFQSSVAYYYQNVKYIIFPDEFDYMNLSDIWSWEGCGTLPISGKLNL